jgi:hypothetical protein
MAHAATIAMQNILLKIQDALLGMDSLSVGVGGAVLALLGLILWLGGSRHSGMVIGILGAAVGAVGGLFMGHWFDWSIYRSVPIGAVVLAILAALMRDVVIILLAACLFAMIAGGTYLSYSARGQEWERKIRDIQSLAGKPLSESSSGIHNPADLNYLRFLSEKMKQPKGENLSAGERAKTTLQEVWAELRYAADSNHSMLILWTLIGAGAGLAAAYLLKKVAMAMCCSMVGTAMTFMAACAVLLAKKTPVITDMMDRPKIVLWILSGMILFGFLVQLIIGKPKKVKEDKEAKP